MEGTQKRQAQGVGAVLASATCFALTSILIKAAYELGLNPMQVIALQSWMASFLLLIYALFFQRQIFKISRRTLMIMIFQGVVGSLGTSVLYAYALKFLPVSVAILLLYLYPALVVAAGVLFWHKRVGRQELIALLLTLSGTTMASGVFSGVQEVAFIGILLGLASAISYAVFNVVGEMAMAEVTPLAAMSFSQWICSLALVFLLKGDFMSIPWHDVRTWEMGFLLATVASIFPFYMILVGIDRIGSDQAAILSTFELPMTFILAAIFLKEFPTLNQWIGGVLVLGGILLLNWRSKGEHRNEEALYQERSN